MKKMAFILAVILVISIPLSAAAATRGNIAPPELIFSGTTATCKAMASGNVRNDFVQVTMKLKQGSTVLQSWYQDGFYQIQMEKTYSGLTKGQTYTLEVTVIINGVKQTASTSGTC